MSVEEHRLTTTRTARLQSVGDLETADEVWMVIHGFGQLAAEFVLPFGAIAGVTRAVIAPEALNKFYHVSRETGRREGQRVGATWMTREDREVEIADYVAYLDAVATEFGRARPLTVLGFSQGVSTMMRWIVRGSHPVSRVIVWAGEIPPELDLAEHRARFPAAGVEIVIGSVDEYATWINLDAIKRRFEAADIPLRVQLFDGGHRLDRETLLSLVSQ